MDRWNGAHARGLGLVAAALLGGCGGPQGGPPGADAGGGPGPSVAEPAEASPWRFVPTLVQHLPAGAVGEPVLELSQPRQRTVVILAAVLRAGAQHVEIERWTFAQSPDGLSLQLLEGGEAMVRLRPGARNPELGDLRRALAAPRVVLTRPLGLDTPAPRVLLDQLATAFSTLHDAKAEPRARVAAAATVVRGLDDTVVLERDAIWQVAALLQPLAGAETSATIEVEVLAERRARARLPHAGGTATLELQRKSDGWAISGLELPTSEPSLAIPGPGEAGSSSGSAG